MTVSMTQTIVTMDKVHRNPLFLQAIEDHLPYFLRTGRFSEHGLDAALALKYAGDFNGLMAELRFAPKLYYPSMRLIGLRNPADFKGTETSIRIISPDYYDLFVNTWRAQNRSK